MKVTEFGLEPLFAHTSCMDCGQPLDEATDDIDEAYCAGCADSTVEDFDKRGDR